ncbi:hypothetical protein RND81_02G128500 [Saponaria officinalis]|uniref:BZIP domain-containing protein n=1 Tax=Saponaria officinalis TaxID=3572 RepID=A0AAW1MSJ3_SAPOF
MGGSDDGESSKSDKSSPRATGTEPNNVHVYPEWAAMQAYYGPRVAMPSYYNPTVASGHLPHPYMWGPQPMMSPYGAPYAAIYAAGGVYAHPAVPLGTPAHGQGAVNEPLTATPLSIDTPVKSPAKTDKGLMKKLKGFDGLAMSIGNPDADADAKAEGSAENRMSQSAETDGSSNGSDGNSDQADKNRKRSRERTSSDGEGEQAESKTPRPATDKVLGLPINPANAAAGHVMGTVAPSVSTALELLNPAVDMKGNSATVSSNTVVSSEVWIQNEREMKRERRKQSNRESARRSRLRRQAEAEELGRKVDSLNVENLALKTEITQFVENSKKLRLENAVLLEKLKSLQSEEDENAVDVKINPTDSTENLLSRVNNSGSVGRSSEEGKKSGGSKFHQLLNSKPRADAVAAG